MKRVYLKADPHKTLLLRFINKADGVSRRMYIKLELEPYVGGVASSKHLRRIQFLCVSFLLQHVDVLHQVQIGLGTAIELLD